MLCYKYMPYKRFKESILPGGAFIKVSRPSEFNDPFDCVGVVEGELSNNVAKEYCNMFCADVTTKHYGVVAKAHFMASMLYRQFFNEWFRILSLSDESCISPQGEALMWAHYADNAKGVRLTIDFSKYSERVEPITYADKATVLNCTNVSAMNPMKDTVLRQFLDSCLTTKYRCWQYECEHRVIFPVDWKDLKPMTAGDSVRAIQEQNLVWAMPKEMLCGVAFGPAFPDLSEGQRYVAVLKNNGYENINSISGRDGWSYC